MMTEATNALSAAFTEIGGSVTDVLLMSLPIGLGIVGLVIAVKFGINWFRSLVQ